MEAYLKLEVIEGEKEDKSFYRVKDPLQYSSGYSLHLYCDHISPEHKPWDFPYMIDHLETKKDAMQYAKQVGWIFHKGCTATCPKCARVLRGQ